MLKKCSSLSVPAIFLAGILQVSSVMATSTDCADITKLKGVELERCENSQAFKSSETMDKAFNQLVGVSPSLMAKWLIKDAQQKWVTYAVSECFVLIALQGLDPTAKSSDAARDVCHASMSKKREKELAEMIRVRNKLPRRPK